MIDIGENWYSSYLFIIAPTVISGDVVPVATGGSTPTESISSVSLEEESLAQMPVPQPAVTPSPPVAKETEPETIVKEDPPQRKPRNMGRLEKDLGRQILTLNRSTPQVSEHQDSDSDCDLRTLL